jgi:hypothetical protein
MPVTITSEVDYAALRRMAQPGGIVHEKVREVTERVADRCRVLAPRGGSGHLSGSIKTAYTSTATTCTGIVYSELAYSVYVQRGTGLYGPVGQMIRPRRASVMVFPVGGKMVFARQVRGVHPRPFMTEGLRAGSPWPVTILPYSG